jgi:hypothetical protein
LQSLCTHPDKQQSSKLGEWAEGIHVGFAEDKKAYMIYNWNKRRLLESRDIEFEEGDDKKRVVVELGIKRVDNVEDGEVPKGDERNQYAGGRKMLDQENPQTTEV